MKTSCIRHPEKSRYIQLHAWQVEFCRGNHCAALLLSYFSTWHDWKLVNDQYYQRANTIAEMHGDGRPHNENAYLFFSTENLIDGCMGLYGKKAVTDALDLLVELRVITVHKNPNPRYHFDKTKYFQFYPNICNRWIASNCPIEGDDDENNTQPIDYSDSAKASNRTCENALPSAENSQPSRQSTRPITNTTNNTTNNNQSTNPTDDDFPDSQNKTRTDSESNVTALIVDTLIGKGMSPNKFYPDCVAAIERMTTTGATLQHFVDAFDLAMHTTKGGGFGVNYLIKAVEGLLARGKSASYLPAQRGDRKAAVSNAAKSEPVYENDIKNGLSWINGV